MLTSLHVQRYQGWQDQFLRELGAQWAKVVNPPLDTPIMPSVPHVAVRFWSDDVSAAYIARGYEGGRQFVRDQAGAFRRVQARGKVLELWNESDCNSNEGLIQLRQATLGAIDEANAQGITLAILNAAEGNPHDNGTGNDGVVTWKWWQLQPCIDAAVRYGHYLGRHCYWRPDVEGPTGRWHALGRLEADIAMLKDLGVDVDNLKILVNEFGIDGGIGGHEETKELGWRHFEPSGDTYRAQIVEGEAYARAHLPQVGALMLFTSGYEGKWASFEHDVVFCGSLIGPLLALDATPAPPDVPPSIPMPATPGPTIVLAPPIEEADIARNKDGSLRITQRFTPPSHYGIDYSCHEGTPIFAAIDGVAYRGDQGTAGFGRYIRIEDDAGLYVYTAHLREWAIVTGARVTAGDLIGYSGNTGNTTGPHLHFEVRRGSRLQASAIDPEPLIVWPEDVKPEPYLPTNDPIMLARKTPQERYTGIRYWIEERRRQYEAGAVEYADQIDAALIEQMYKWERE